MPVLQIGVVPPQFVFDKQATQMRGETLVMHCDVPPLQSLDDAHCSTSTSVVWIPAVDVLPSVG